MNGNSKGEILIVDDEPNALKVLSSILKEEGYGVFAARDVDSAMKVITKEYVDAVITDLVMPGKDGMQFFEYIAENHSDIPVIFITAYGTVESAVSAMVRGVLYYFIKPPDYVKLKRVLADGVRERRLKGDLASVKQQPFDGNGNGRHSIVAKAPRMLDIFRTIESIKDTTSSVLICGETGTGKEVIARALHYRSSRQDRPFIAVNCAAIPRELMEAELFGYEKGAFTGALSRRLGRFEEASGGTVLLDEIGELEPSLQAKLLRVLEEREVERLGSSHRIPVDFRLLCSTNRDLEEEVLKLTFRKDLYYRINVVRIDLPPLRERKEDIPLLVSQCLEEFSQKKEKKVRSVSGDVMEIFMNYHWTGNVRQLRNVIERAVILSKGERITTRELPKELLCSGTKKAPVHQTLRELEVQVVQDVLEVCEGNKSKAAKMLGISRKAFYKRLKELPVSPGVSSRNSLH